MMTPTAPRLAESMSRHASATVLMFATLQTIGVIALADQPYAQLLPYVAMALLLLVALPYARRVERRWRAIGDVALPGPGLDVRYRVERARLWRGAFLLPTLWIGAVALLNILVR